MMNYDEVIDEEMLIAQEQDTDETVLHAEVFKQKIKVLTLPRPLCAKGDDSLALVISAMKDSKVGAVLVVSNKNQVVGILTERDVLNKVIGVVSDLDEAEVKDFMTKDPETLHHNDMICFALHNMHIGGYRNIPIINDDGTPYAMMNVQTINNFILDYFPREVTNILSEPYTGVHLRESA